MKRPHLDELPEIAVPVGYTLRTYRAGDEAAWGEIMNSPQGIGSEWTPEKVRERLIDKPQFRAGGLFFATSDADGGRPVASACAWLKDPAELALGTLHMVAALPEHRGRGLGRLVCLAVLHHFRGRGFRAVDLSTDDFRVPAIKSYLGLGFVPEYLDDPTGFDNHEARWSALFQTILGRS
jgi:mycothiol synthase